MKLSAKYAGPLKKKKPVKKTVLSKNDYKNLQGVRLENDLDKFFKAAKR